MWRQKRSTVKSLLRFFIFEQAFSADCAEWK
jgi:hypothetical protein